MKRFQPLTNKNKGKVFYRIITMTLTMIIIMTSLMATTACSQNKNEETTTSTPTGTSYPLTVTDLMGRTVTVNQKPVKIVTVHPTATETLYKVGGVVVGHDTGSKYPPEAQSLPTIGGSYTPSVEAITALSPDLIVLEALSQGSMVTTLEKIGVPVVAVRATSLNDVVQSLTMMGKIIDQNETAATSVTQIQNQIEGAVKTTKSGRKILVFISDANRNIYVAKPESYPGALLALLNQDNLAQGLPDTGPYPGFSLYTAEQASLANIDVIFCISPAPAPAPKLSTMLPQIPGFNQMNAVKTGKVKELDPALFLQAPGPRIGDAVQEMARLLNEVAP